MNEGTRLARQADRILDIIKREPGISGTGLNVATKSIGEDARNEIIADLIECEEIRVKVVNGKGRPRKLYFAVAAVDPTWTPQRATAGLATADPARLTLEQIRAYNEHRRRLNETAEKYGCPAKPLLPETPGIL